MLILAWFDASQLIQSFIPNMPPAAHEPLGRAFAEARSDFALTPTDAARTLAILKHHARRFDRMLGRYGRDAFYGTTLPKALRTYADDPPFMDQALANMLAVAEDVSVRKIDWFFTEQLPAAMDLYGFDIYELADPQLRHDRVMRSNARAQEFEDRVGAILDPEAAAELSREAFTVLLHDYEVERREQVETLMNKAGLNEVTPYFRYHIDRDLEEEHTRLHLADYFRAKLASEADPEEAAILLEKLNSTQRVVTQYRARARSRRSQVGRQIADTTYLQVEERMMRYIETPSKVYSVLTRGHIDQALEQVCEIMGREDRAMDEPDPLRVVSDDIPGVLTRAEVRARGADLRSFPVPHEEMIGLIKRTCRVVIEGSELRIYGTRGRPYLKRRDTLACGVRVSESVLAVQGSFDGVLRVPTDESGSIVLEKTGSGRTLRTVRLDAGILPPSSRLLFRLTGEEARLTIGGREVTVLLPKLREAMRQAPEPHATGLTELFVFEKPGCNITMSARGHDVGDIGADFIARRLAEIIDLLLRTYPGRRLEAILPETLEVHVRSQRNMRGNAGTSNERGDIHLVVDVPRPLLAASVLMHEDAHALCAKVLGDVARFVAERFRTAKAFLGTKTVTDMVEEAVKEVFARLVQLRFLTDAVRAGTAAPSEADEQVRELLSNIRMDVAHYRRQQMLSPEGETLMDGFEAECDELERTWSALRLMDPPPPPPAVEPLTVKRYPGGSSLASIFDLDALAEGFCHEALKRYGLLPGQRRPLLPGSVPKALPSPAAETLMGRVSSTPKRERPAKRRQARRIECNREVHDQFSDWLFEHPEKREKAASFREEWKTKIRLARQIANEDPEGVPFDPNDGD